jgi:hypothetical protein
MGCKPRRVWLLGYTPLKNSLSQEPTDSNVCLKLCKTANQGRGMGALRKWLVHGHDPLIKSSCDALVPLIGRQDGLLVARQALKGLYQAPPSDTAFDELLAALHKADKAAGYPPLGDEVA